MSSSADDSDAYEMSSALKSRVNATKARLADLDAEMSSISDRQAEREQRKSNIRRLLNESDSTSAATSSTLESRSVVKSLNFMD